MSSYRCKTEGGAQQPDRRPAMVKQSVTRGADSRFPERRNRRIYNARRYKEKKRLAPTKKEFIWGSSTVGGGRRFYIGDKTKETPMSVEKNWLSGVAQTGKSSQWLELSPIEPRD